LTLSPIFIQLELESKGWLMPPQVGDGGGGPLRGAVGVKDSARGAANEPEFVEQLMAEAAGERDTVIL
jgi:hypothetical protein